MSDLNDWIKERRRIHDAAAEGPWEDTSEDCDSLQVKAGHLTPRYRPEGAPWPQRYDDYRTRLITSDPAGSVWSGAVEDVHAIVDAHNTLPALLTVVEKVLERHTRVVTDQHIDGPTAVCEQCSEDRMFQLWPCETVLSVQSAIEGAIR